MDPAALLMFRKLCFPPNSRLTTFCPREGLFDYAQTVRRQHQILLMTLFIREPHYHKRELGHEGEQQFREALITHLEHIVRRNDARRYAD